MAYASASISPEILHAGAGGESHVHGLQYLEVGYKVISAFAGVGAVVVTRKWAAEKAAAKAAKEAKEAEGSRG